MKAINVNNYNEASKLVRNNKVFNLVKRIYKASQKQTTAKSVRRQQYGANLPTRSTPTRIYY